ncbi:hypothetical protein JKG47_05840, partial [Acidithiobacillus sp. MC6.1]|nr:hypothetical protein [Acidithiobacillus sp. MC6.1]
MAPDKLSVLGGNRSTVGEGRGMRDLTGLFTGRYQAFPFPLSRHHLNAATGQTCDKRSAKQEYGVSGRSPEQGGL